MTKPTAAAMRAVENLGLVSECAEVIDQETGLPELIAALNACFGVIEALPDPDRYEIDAMERVKAALKIAREGRS